MYFYFSTDYFPSYKIFQLNILEKHHKELLPFWPTHITFAPPFPHLDMCTDSFKGAGFFAHFEELSEKKKKKSL